MATTAKRAPTTHLTKRVRSGDAIGAPAAVPLVVPALLVPGDKVYAGSTPTPGQDDTRDVRIPAVPAVAPVKATILRR